LCAVKVDRSTVHLGMKEQEILASAELNPYDSVRRRKQDSSVNRDNIWHILEDNKFHFYKMSIHQPLNYNDF